ncbi:Uncharacterised protein [Bordetella pertussis]|nr:Uncharacterised protein [Bordetella pertussis]CFN66147.1 Uncharacterised protein [Bordetella pertussis]CFN82189.1 Uncharacterised protein [Bordetella pertussis]CFO05613.1 Uncharacterised protein [Bordetella pertussis]CFO37171.1 Uncharacterised protein [Bordetella pertussis]
MAKVRTGCALCACIRATTVDESMPPERNAPRLTSDSIWPRTACDTTCSSASIACASDSKRRRSPRPWSAARRADQYTWGSGNSPRRICAASISTQAPGGSLRMPA